MDKEEEIAWLKKQLQQTKDSFEQFAYSVSHDMREPVRMVKSFMDLLLRKYSETLDEKATSYVGFASEGAGRADLMIQDLLFYYRAVRGMEYQPADPNLSVAGAVTKLKSKLDARQAIIKVQPLPKVMGDTAGLQEIFTYLLDHLVQQVPLTEIPVIVIEATTEGHSWAITCTANGSAPEMGELRDLFRLFYNRAQQPSADSTLNKLAVAKRIIEHLNGELLATEAKTGGVQFLINLPAVKS